MKHLVFQAMMQPLQINFLSPWRCGAKQTLPDVATRGLTREELRDRMCTWLNHFTSAESKINNGLCEIEVTLDFFCRDFILGDDSNLHPPFIGAHLLPSFWWRKKDGLLQSLLSRSTIEWHLFFAAGFTELCKTSFPMKLLHPDDPAATWKLALETWYLIF